MEPTTARLFEALEDLDGDERTVVTSVRQPAALREALAAAVAAGMDDTPNQAVVAAVRDRIDAFAQRLALDLHYQRVPAARPSLVEVALAAARLDGDPLAGDVPLLRRAADEVVSTKPDADADDVLVYARDLHARGARRRATRTAS